MSVKWTTERPTKPGWYWYRTNPGGYPIIERYDMSGNGLAFWSKGKIFPLLDGEYAGPLEPPQ